MKKIFILLILLTMIGCSNNQKKQSSLNKKYEKHKLKGVASYYGDAYHKKRTASGEIFYKNQKTAAHKTLPFGMIVRVTNIENGKSVDVKINDRGPFVEGRIIDLSEGAFKKIANKNEGLAKVEIDILNDENLFRYKK